VLTEKDKRYFKKCLTQMLNESLGKVQGTLAHVSDLEDRPSDKADQASIASDVGFALRIRDREEKLIEKIIEALEKLDVGTFGICEACGEEIPLKRLMARPMTTLCIECKKEQEAQERRRAMNYQSVDY
jgi:DnaK suppressor protein